MTQRQDGLPRIETGVPIAPRTTIGVGGPAAWWWPVRDARAIRRALAFARARGVPWWVVGGGSNVVVADAGLPGVVIHPVAPAEGWRARDRGSGRVDVTAAAGVRWDDLVAWSVARGLQGIECLAGIPGQVGAAPIQNIGAYGQEFADVAVDVRAWDVERGEIVRTAAPACAFAYRDSLFKREPGRRIVTAVTIRLQAGATPCLAYAQVAEAVGAGTPTLASVAAAVIALRRAKGMVADPLFADARSCGSFFTNPVVAISVADAACARLGADGAPRWPQPDGRVKLSAAWLIERAGFQRGDGDGRVGLSRRHALAVVNRGGASAAEILAFADRVAAAVRHQTGIVLEREPVVIGV